MEEQLTDFDHLQDDQEVYSSDGQMLGYVAAIDANIDTGEPYLDVATDRTPTLYVPKSCVAIAVVGKPVRLKVSAEEARERFSKRPNLI